jgi:hypothetical protein
VELTRQSWLAAFNDQRKTWSRLLYRPHGIHCLPTGCRRHADTRRGFTASSTSLQFPFITPAIFSRRIPISFPISRLWASKR